MPYRINPANAACIQVQNGDAWQDVKCHDNAAQADAHLMALTLNVSEAKPAIASAKSLNLWLNVGRALVKARKAQAAKSAAVMPAMRQLSDEDTVTYEDVYSRVLADTGDELKATLAAMGMVKRARLRLAVKAEGEVIVGGWAIMFGDDQHKDLVQTYFNPHTDFALDNYTRGLLWYEHGYNKDYGVRPIGERVAHERYQHGIWLEHKLYDDHPLFERTKKDLEDGVLAYSSDSIEHLVQEGSTRDGNLRYWPLVGCSLVHRPAEPGLGGVVIK